MKIVASVNKQPSIKTPDGATTQIAKPSQPIISRRHHLLAIPTILTSTLCLDNNNQNAAMAASTISGDWSSPGLASVEDDQAPKFYKTPSGVAVQELYQGNGDTAVQPGNRVLIDYVLRRSNGYFIYSTVEGASFQPKDIPTGAVALTLKDGEVIPGLIDGLVGLKPGGKRRILVPSRLGYSSAPEPRMPTFATSRQLENHKSEPLLFEVELLRIIS